MAYSGFRFHVWLHKYGQLFIQLFFYDKTGGRREESKPGIKLMIDLPVPVPLVIFIEYPAGRVRVLFIEPER